MTVLEEIDRRPLQEMNREEMVSWLEKGLRGYLLGGDGAWVFGRAAIYIGRTEHLVSDFREIYRSLPPDYTRIRFRVAVATVLSRLPEEQEAVTLFEHLLGIAAVVEAYEVLGVLRQRVGRGYFGLTDGLDGHSLFAQTLDFVAGLAKAPDESVLETLDALIDSPYFKPVYANWALFAYCRADDKSLPEHLDKLRPAFAEAQADEGFWGDEVAQNIAWQVTDILGWPEIARVLPKLRYIPDISKLTPAERALPRNEIKPLFYKTDRWLLKGLFTGPSAPAKLSRSELHGYVLEPAERKQRYPIGQEGDAWGDMLDFFNECIANDASRGAAREDDPSSILDDEQEHVALCG